MYVTVKCADCTLDGHLHRVTHTRCPINTIHSPDDEHRGARNMYRVGINVYEKRIVRQVGYLQEIKMLYKVQMPLPTLRTCIGETDCSATHS